MANELDAADVEQFLRVGFTMHIDIIAQTKNDAERWFYIRKVARDFIGKRQLHQMLASDLYHQHGSMPSNFALTLPDDKQRQVAMQTFKEDNVLDFLKIPNPDLVDELDVEEQIVKNVKNFMMSLGGEFAFMGEQYRLIVNGRERKLDLLFYHRRMRCLVAIELKGGEFQPEYAGKLNYYLSALDSLVKLPEENPSIGILLCRDKDNTEVEFTLRDMSKPMGVATYRSSPELPAQYRNALPSADDLKRLL
jgi:predicted nuclease of restriction endonuclease-like (RecB) superfamily